MNVYFNKGMKYVFSACYYIRVCNFITAIVLIIWHLCWFIQLYDRENIMADAILNFEYKCNFKGHSGQQRPWGHVVIVLKFVPR